LIDINVVYRTSDKRLDRHAKLPFFESPNNGLASDELLIYFEFLSSRIMLPQLRQDLNYAP
jgi:hypothetical protein